MRHISTKISSVLVEHTIEETEDIRVALFNYNGGKPTPRMKEIAQKYIDMVMGYNGCFPTGDVPK